MNNTKRIVIAILVVFALAAGAIWFMSTNKKPATNSESQSSSQTQPPANGGNQTGSIAAIITYDGNKFTVSTDEVDSGSKIKVENKSQEDLDFNSNPHPIHTDNSELNQSIIAPGTNKVFTLTAKGEWGFHNHLNSSQHGTITVK